MVRILRTSGNHHSISTIITITDQILIGQDLHENEVTVGITSNRIANIVRFWAVEDKYTTGKNICKL